MSAAAPAPAAARAAPPIHVAHLVYSFAAGGLENVIAQLINGLPADRYRHSLIAVSTIDPDYARRITRAGVGLHELRKGPGQPYRLYPKLLRLLRTLQPDVVHSCNLAALDFAPVSAWAGVPRRIHAEHGWTADDRQGTNRKKQWMRRAYRPFVSDYVAVSAEIADYLTERIGVPAHRVHLIENGVDLSRFSPRPAGGGWQPPPGFPFDPARHCIVGTVGRLEPVKNHALLLDAFARARTEGGAAAQRLRLAMVGDGPLRDAVRARIDELGLADQVWLAGSRNDVPALLRAFDVFVLCSVAEGTSCALQEALASGLAVVATDVGANRRLLADGAMGRVIDSGDTDALTAALVAAAQQGGSDAAERQRVARHAQRAFALETTLQQYDRLFSSAGPAWGV